MKNGLNVCSCVAVLAIFQFLFQLSVSAETRKATIEPVETNICAIAHNPRYFNNKIVMFRAEFDKPWLERAMLSDQNCNTVGIVPNLSKHVKGEELLDRALNSGHPGTMGKIIIATWIGRFRWRPKEFPNRILDVNEIREVTAEHQ